MDWQHYVPRFYLRGFTTKKEWVNAIVRNENRLIIQSTHIGSIGAKHRYYEEVPGDRSTDYDGEINQVIENKVTCSPTWAKIREDRYDDINIDDHFVLANLMMHLLLRNPDYRDMLGLNSIVFRDLEPQHARNENELLSVMSSRRPDLIESYLRFGSTDPSILADSIEKYHLFIMRSSIGLCTSTSPHHPTPVVIKHRGKEVAGLGLALNKNTYAVLIRHSDSDTPRVIKKHLSYAESNNINAAQFRIFAGSETVQAFIYQDLSQIDRQVLFENGWNADPDPRKFVADEGCVRARHTMREYVRRNAPRLREVYRSFEGLSRVEFRSIHEAFRNKQRRRRAARRRDSP